MSVGFYKVEKVVEVENALIARRLTKFKKLRKSGDYVMER